MNKGIVQIKETHKKIAEEIKFLKSLRPISQESKIPEELIEALKKEYSFLFGEHYRGWYSKRDSIIFAIDAKLRHLSIDFRLKHIAYCLNRGRTYEQIEKPKEQNELHSRNWQEIKKYQEEYRKIYEANVPTIAE